MGITGGAASPESGNARRKDNTAGFNAALVRLTPKLSGCPEPRQVFNCKQTTRRRAVRWSELVRVSVIPIFLAKLLHGLSRRSRGCRSGEY